MKKFFKDLKKGAKEEIREIGETAKGLKRAIRDEISPPSTETQLREALGDTWGELRHQGRKLKGEARAAYDEVGKTVDKLVKDSPTLQDLSAGLKDLSKDLDKAVKKSPVLTSLSNFLKKSCSLIASIAGTAKDRTKA